ncbi:retrovirus-related pol polyprotein from transposon TNT 1-94 [Tanacetum coccineum]|uniref:Retrovirus-related pol polyprotein from transposon TNT 1-94 n=1 Tax=Tanacetum coccineum TaxID=301880 RepID=A0ABQ4ZW81_9ASTR
MNAILGVYTDLDEVTVSNLQCDYLETLEKYEHLEKELSKSRTMSKSFEALQKHAINFEFDLQQCKEKIKNDKSFKENQSNVFLKEREQYFEIQDLKAQLQDKGIAISELKKLIEKMKGKSVETKFEKSSVIRQPNAFKSQRQSILGKPAIFLDSLEKKDFSKSKSGMYKVHTKPNQTRTPQLPQDIRKTNKRVSFSTGVIPTTSVSRPQLKSNQMEDRVMPNNSQGKKQEVEDHHRNFKSKDETPGVLIDFLTLVQRGLHAQVLTVRADKGTRNRTLVEGARTMLSAAKVPLFFWAAAIATTCFTQNHSLVIPRHEKTPYHIINARKPSVKFFHIFGSLCYISKAYRVFNKRTRMIVETIHVNFDELPQMASDHENVPQIAETVTTSNELELLHSPMFSELLNETSPVVSKFSAVHAADNPDKRHQHNTTHTSTTTDVADPPPLNIHSTHQTPIKSNVTAPD